MVILGTCVKCQVAGCGWEIDVDTILVSSFWLVFTCHSRLFLSSCYDSGKATWPGAVSFLTNTEPVWKVRAAPNGIFCQWDQPMHEIIIWNRPTTMAIIKTHSLLLALYVQHKGSYWFKGTLMKHPYEKNKGFGWLWRRSLSVCTTPEILDGNQHLP